MKWIKASERLPEINRKVIMRFPWHDNTIALDEGKLKPKEELDNQLWFSTNNYGSKPEREDGLEWLDETTPVPDKVEFGEWQQCPVCNGTGRAMDYNNPIPSTLDVCTVCGGKKIIAKPNWQSTQSDAVEFAEWTDDNGWWREVYNFDGDSEKLWSKTSSCWENITTEQLYQLFKQK